VRKRKQKPKISAKKEGVKGSSENNELEKRNNKGNEGKVIY
jgi:hypothetical protein